MTTPGVLAQTAVNNSTWANASSDMASSFGTTAELAVLVVVALYVIGALLAAQVVSPWLAQSALLSVAGRRFVESLQYAVKGVAATAVLLLVAAPVYLLATADGGTRGAALTWLGVAVAGYVGLVVAGWLADRAVAAFIDAHPDATEWADLFPEADGDADLEPAEEDVA